jgi:hypothetical protein
MSETNTENMELSPNFDFAGRILRFARSDVAVAMRFRPMGRERGA